MGKQEKNELSHAILSEMQPVDKAATAMARRKSVLRNARPVRRSANLTTADLSEGSDQEKNATQPRTAKSKGPLSLKKVGELKRAATQARKIKERAGLVSKNEAKIFEHF